MKIVTTCSRVVEDSVYLGHKFELENVILKKFFNTAIKLSGYKSGHDVHVYLAHFREKKMEE